MNNNDAIQLLETWLADDTLKDSAAWSEIKAALDKHAKSHAAKPEEEEEEEYAYMGFCPQCKANLGIDLSTGVLSVMVYP